jgi:magnesium transporter
MEVFFMGICLTKEVFFMIGIYKTCFGSDEITKLDEIENGCWINMVAPTEEELDFISEKAGVMKLFLKYPLDPEERARIDTEDDEKLIIVEAPYVTEDMKTLTFETMPLGILVTNNYIITISRTENTVINSFISQKRRLFFTFKKTRFALQILYGVAGEFLKFLRQIDKKTDDLEESLHKSMKNKELFRLLSIEKSLVYFSNSLKSNEVVMDKLLKGKYLKMYEEDQDLLEDVIIENKQALDMSRVYSSTLSVMMSAFASVISNNLNIVMKVLTSITIVMAIPTMIASFLGMNVPMPFNLGSRDLAFVFVIITSLAIALIVFLLLRKRQMF